MDFDSLNVWCWLIPLLVGVICGILGYLILNIGGQLFFANGLSWGLPGIWVGISVSFGFSAMYVVILCFLYVERPTRRVFPVEV